MMLIMSWRMMPATTISILLTLLFFPSVLAPCRSTLEEIFSDVAARDGSFVCYQMIIQLSQHLVSKSIIKLGAVEGEPPEDEDS